MGPMTFKTRLVRDHLDGTYGLMDEESGAFIVSGESYAVCAAVQDALHDPEHWRPTEAYEVASRIRVRRMRQESGLGRATGSARTGLVVHLLFAWASAMAGIVAIMTLMDHRYERAFWYVVLAVVLLYCGEWLSAEHQRKD